MRPAIVRARTSGMVISCIVLPPAPQVSRLRSLLRHVRRPKSPAAAITFVHIRSESGERESSTSASVMRLVPSLARTGRDHENRTRDAAARDLIYHPALDRGARRHWRQGCRLQEQGNRGDSGWYQRSAPILVTIRSISRGFAFDERDTSGESSDTLEALVAPRARTADPESKRR